MSHFRMTVSRLGFSLVLSLTASVASATDEPRAKIVEHAVLTLPELTTAQPEAHVAPQTDPSNPEQHDLSAQPLMDAAYSGRTSSDRATDSSKDASRRRYFAMRRLAEARGSASGHWRWIETDRRANASGSRGMPRDNYKAQPRYGEAPYSTRPNLPPNWAYPNGAARRYPPSASEPYQAYRPYRYQSATGYGYVR